MILETDAINFNRTFSIGIVTYVINLLLALGNLSSLTLISATLHSCCILRRKQKSSQAEEELDYIWPATTSIFNFLPHHTEHIMFFQLPAVDTLTFLLQHKIHLITPHLSKLSARYFWKQRLVNWRPEYNPYISIITVKISWIVCMLLLTRKGELIT